MSKKFCWTLHNQKVKAEQQDLIQPNHPLTTQRDGERRGRETEQERAKQYNWVDGVGRGPVLARSGAGGEMKKD